MNKQLLIISAFFLSASLFAQAPAISWQKTLGGSDADNLQSIIQGSNGNLVVAGVSMSPISGDKTTMVTGNLDTWTLSLDQNSGGIAWQNSYGNWYEYLNIDNKVSVSESDNTYYIGGTGSFMDTWNMTLKTVLPDGTLVTNAGSSEYSCGGASNAFGTTLTNFFKTADGNYLCGGSYTSAFTCDPSFFLNKTGTPGTAWSPVWNRFYDGYGTDTLKSIEETSDGGYILLGQSNSTASGDKTENSNGLFDLWIIKIDTGGNIQWQNTIGGSNLEEAATIQQTADGGYIVGGSSNSPVSGDKTENSKGGYDYWILKLNATGNIVWQKTIGGSLDDKLSKVIPVTEGYICAGTSSSNISGDKTQNSKGGKDFWAVKISESGTIAWDKTIGGTLDDIANDIVHVSDGGFVIAGSSLSSISGDKNEVARGDKDYWIVKLASENLSLHEHAFDGVAISPNPMSESTSVLFGDLAGNAKITVTNILGQIVLQEIRSGEPSHMIKITGESGIYLITVENESNQKRIFKVIKN